MMWRTHSCVPCRHSCRHLLPAYDSLHRLTSATYPSGGYSSVTPPKYYVYDSATVNNIAMTYAKGRLAEAYTGNSKTTDLGFSYSNRGEAAGVYQSSPHSGGYYHVAATYWASRGLLDTLNPNMTGIPTWTYAPDGEGRANTVSASSGTNPVTATSYNSFSEPTGVTFGSTDADAFQYDATTGRMTQYKATINSQATYGGLTWNANWTLKQLAITDPYNTGNNNKTCGYTYDDLARLSQVDCGSGNWGQTFSYLDNVTNNIAAFRNISKSVITGRTGQSFTATYSDTTNRLTTSGVTYDNNGNLTYDGSSHYTWDGEGNMATLGGNAETYDALGRRVEQYNGTAYTEIVYGPGGNKLALMNGQTVTKVFAPLPGGATAVYASSGLAYYRHPDWLGSSRLASTPARGIYYDGAYAPYGEPYAETGTTDRNFTGQNQDLTPGSTGNLYDFPNREYHSTQGRWVSPDPAGMAAVDPTNPQSWNRYAYVMGDPTGLIDPLGLDVTMIFHDPPMNCQEWFVFVFNMTNGMGQFCGGYQAALQSALGPTVFYGGYIGGGAGPAPNNGACSSLSLDNPAAFNNAGAATPQQVQSFFSGYPNVPGSWNGSAVGTAFSGAGLNPGLGVGIIGAETSFNPSGPRNIRDPFSSGGANFTSSLNRGLGAIQKIVGASFTSTSPLSNLINGNNGLRGAGLPGMQYDTTGVGQWYLNVNSFYRKFVKSIGGCK
jgi:RHS repeat-associated protein